MFFHHTEASLNSLNWTTIFHYELRTWLSNNQTLQPSTIEALHIEQNGTRCEYAFLQNICEPKFRFVETNIFQELKKLSEDGNAMDHSYIGSYSC